MLIWFLGAIATTQPIDCNNAMTTADMLTCAAQDIRNAERAMDQAYQAANAIMVSMDIGRDKSADKRIGYHDALVASQKAWTSFREAQCVTEGYGARGGSMESLLVASCKEEITKARTKQLQSLVQLLRD